ncbi:MAG: ABC transporter ATP-binding protein [Phascolarctobacterium sp.]|uniref:ABC transporter ATP-binding protein n=1 Tax=Phascolarctobacterium sp. TaxID=2049039 RepID=UPI0026DB4E74|nr:ABC transporter ATP-binding protein [Phascolarctobacterium sp.]MDO4921261.1 ABC transporter ATP-binding protein [Phascolarctobacterium sp.]
MKKLHIYMDNVDMCYPSNVYNATTLKQEIFSYLKLEKPKPLLKDVHALKNFTLHVEQGERLGVIGHNGSGKSTLLKTIAGIYPIVSGDIDVQGKIKALFDIGLGFDLESTGRENIVYRGLLLGASPQEIEAKTKEIIDFTELGNFIDFPIKSYSSGMLVRLAFAVSTSLSGEILLLDEVVAAGDAAFMEKARKRMLDLIYQASIMVFVTHDLAMAEQVCNRVIMLDHGNIVADGNPKEIIKYYKNHMAKKCED